MLVIVNSQLFYAPNLKLKEDYLNTRMPGSRDIQHVKYEFEHDLVQDMIIGQCSPIYSKTGAFIQTVPPRLYLTQLIHIFIYRNVAETMTIVDDVILGQVDAEMFLTWMGEGRVVFLY
jgi:hypothetical protein